MQIPVWSEWTSSAWADGSASAGHPMYCRQAGINLAAGIAPKAIDSSRLAKVQGHLMVQVFEILVQGLFEPSQRLPVETQRTYVQLLATAASAVDQR